MNNWFDNKIPKANDIVILSGGDISVTKKYVRLVNPINVSNSFRSCDKLKFTIDKALWLFFFNVFAFFM